MPVAPNPLLQGNTVAKTSRSANAQADKPLQAPGDKGDGFGQVMARQGRDKVAGQDDKVAQARPKDKPEAAQGGKKDPADKPAVADDGKQLPADDQVQADTGLRDASLVAGQITDAQPGAQLIQAQAEAVAPVLQAATAQVQTSVTAALPEEPAAEEAFDPDADPLANLPTLRLALEHSAQAKGRPRRMPWTLRRLKARRGRWPSIPWRIWSSLPRVKKVSLATGPLVPCSKMA